MTTTPNETSTNTTSPPPPPYDVVRSTCSAFQTDRVTVDHDAAKSFATNDVDIKAVKEFGANLASDPNFTGTACTFVDVDTEVAMILLMHALDFGSGWRLQLHAHHGRGAWLSIKPGVEQFYNDHPKLLSKELAETTIEEVAQTFNFVGNTELDDLVELLHMVIVELGTQTMEYGSLPNFIKHQLERLSQCQSTTPAGDLVWTCVRTFPKTFDDKYDVNGQTVCFYKKAQLSVGEMYHRFRTEDPRLDFVDGPRLTAYVDNVIVASMRYKGVIVPCSDLTKQIESNTPIVKGSEDEVALRASAMNGVELIVKLVNEMKQSKKNDKDGNQNDNSNDENDVLSSNELGNYLWAGLGKVPAVRKYNRHATKTVFY